MMSEPPRSPAIPPGELAGLRFRWPWRDYQARVLAQMDRHLADRRLHVVAAPGSGKTVLGLETFRRLARPTVVLSPTRTIRDQWLQRLGDFLPADTDPHGLDWQSRDLGALRWFNSLTYQALHTRVRRDRAQGDAIEEAEAEELREETEEAAPSAQARRHVAACLAAAGIEVLILDEAHHLRAEWWAAIQDIVEHLGRLLQARSGVDADAPGGPEHGDDRATEAPSASPAPSPITLVSLTATPPYDVLGHEWNRYIELCGPIDEEISVPELVKAGTLCPHQDFVWLVRSEGRDSERLRAHRRAVAMLLAQLLADDELLADVGQHDWVRSPHMHLGEMVNAPEAAVALAGFLHRRGRSQPDLMQLLDLAEEDLPDFDVRQWQHLLRLYLFGSGWPDDAGFEQRRQLLARRLRSDELLWRRELALTDAGRRWPNLALSADKVQACIDIHQYEHRQRGDALRQVILTDYIRDEAVRELLQPEPVLGAWPLFQQLVGASRCPAPALALHTGRLSIVHVDALALLAEQVAPAMLVERAVPALPEFRQVSLAGDARLTSALTRLLVAGRLQVLVGTRALLGEGWDAPPVNSLILASVVGSFMTTNQMRGRAIRVDPQQPDKVASIWHLGACAELDGGAWDIRDLHEMGRRFETFVGLDHQQPLIEAGLNRLRTGFWQRDQVRVPVAVGAENAGMVRRLAGLGDLGRRWREAIDRSEIGRVVPGVQVDKPPRFAVMQFAGSLRTLWLQLLAVGLILFGVQLHEVLLLSQRTQGLTTLAIAMGVAGIILALVLAPRAFQLLRLWWRHLPVAGAVRGIARALRQALTETGVLPAALRHAPLLIREHGGIWHVALGEGSFSQRSLFADCLNEILAPVERPRYLITRAMQRRHGVGLDYHAVPAILGAQSGRAQAFLAAWQQHVGPGELLYTRSDEGRRLLLQARGRAFANAYERVARRMDRWV